MEVVKTLGSLNWRGKMCMARVLTSAGERREDVSGAAAAVAVASPTGARRRKTSEEVEDWSQERRERPHVYIRPTERAYF